MPAWRGPAAECQWPSDSPQVAAVISLFASEDEVRQSGPVLKQMNPPEGAGTRTAIDVYGVAAEARMLDQPRAAQCWTRHLRLQTAASDCFETRTRSVPLRARCGRPAHNPVGPAGDDQRERVEHRDRPSGATASRPPSRNGERVFVTSLMRELKSRDARFHRTAALRPCARPRGQPSRQDRRDGFRDRAEPGRRR
jgi:hypothetical protein